MDTITSKLGKNKGVEKSRIWIEGARLNAAGFRRGAEYQRDWCEGGLDLVLTNGAPIEALGRIYKVAGKSDHPIIDTTGKKVTATFGHADSVVVLFSVETIRIAAA